MPSDQDPDPSDQDPDQGELDVYTHGHHDSVLRSHRWRTAENSVAYLLPHLRPGMDVLDVGCGPGTITVDLAERVAPGHVTGVDVADVVDEATAVARERGVDNVEFAQGDFREMGLPAQGYDVVQAHQVLQHLRGPVGALAAMAGLAKPGGLVGVRDSDYSAFVWSPAMAPLDRWLEVYLAVARHNGAEPDAGRHLLAWAQAAGLDLEAVTYSTSTWTYADPRDRAWWGDLWAERCLASAFAHQAVEYGIASADELQDISAAWRRWAAEPAGTFVVLHGEILVRC
jgi:2-polyprenyl-3-methyl-5-hydroxy-6-metoxy-1,4-benzoquinol methylase